MKNIELTINGKKVSTEPGTSILVAAGNNGIRVPTLCAHADLTPYGACRICLVEDENTGRLMASCVTPVAQDMTINTDSPRVTANRKNIIRLMIAEHPESCIVCNKGNNCELRMIAAQLGIGETKLYPMPNYKPFETHNPFIVRDLSKCILCGKCIRADHELVAVGAIDYSDRGFASRPATLHEQPLELSNCTFCGTCVSICPTGALSTMNTFFTGTPEAEKTTICGFCGAGCALSMGVSGNRVVEVNPSGDRDSVNRSTLCVRGHFAHDFLFSPDRLIKPMVRRPDEQDNLTLQGEEFDEALSVVAARLNAIKQAHGPESIGFIGSTKCSIEENYLFQKIARVIYGTNNITTTSASGEHALLRRIHDKTGGTWLINPLSSLENAEAIVVAMADPEHTVPIAAYHIKRASKRGTPLVVIDSCRNDMAAFGGTWLQPETSENGRSLDFETVNAIAALLSSKNNEDIPSWMDKKVGSPEKIKKAASMLKDKAIAVVLPGDLLEREHGEEMLDAVFNLAMITGSMGRKNAGIFIPTLENNVHGTFDMGCTPDMLPGRRKIEDAGQKAAMEKMWETDLPGEKGKDIYDMIAAAEAGALKALYIMGENPLRSLPDPERITAALGKLDFLVVQDIIKTRTTDMAHVVLPAAAFAEKQGSFTNMEGRIQGFTPVIDPPGAALPDWAILSMLAEKAGCPVQYKTIEDIRQEIRQVVPLYENLGAHGRQWIKLTDQEIIKMTPTFASIPKQQDANPDFPLTALIINQRWHLGSGTRTSRSARIDSSGKIGEIEISPGDAKRIGLTASDQSAKKKIRLVSPFGAIERAFAINPGLPGGKVHIPQGFSGNDVMRIADFNALKPPGSGWRTISVRIEIPTRSV